MWIYRDIYFVLELTILENLHFIPNYTLQNKNPVDFILFFQDILSQKIFYTPVHYKTPGSLLFLNSA